MKFCEECGAELEDEAVFCENCGFQVNDLHEKDKDKVTEVDSINENDSNVANKKRNTNKLLFGVLIAVIVMFIIISGVAFATGIISFTGKKVENEDIKVVQSTPETVNKEAQSTEEAQITEKPYSTDEPYKEYLISDGRLEEYDSYDYYNDDDDFDYAFQDVDMLDLFSLKSSSELVDEVSDCRTSMICDYNPTTAWSEGVEGNGVGEYVDFIFDDYYIFNGIKICAGYHKSEELYYKNARPKKIMLEFSDGGIEVIKLQDVFEEQIIEFEDKHEADSVRLSIESVYKGSKYSDTLISELNFY